MTLSQRLEQAGPGEQRELLVELWRATIGGIMIDHAHDHPDPKYRTFARLIDINTDEAFLAAAMMMVPEGYFWTTGRCDLTCHASVGPDNAHFDRAHLEAHPPVDVDIPNPSTPALALATAIAKAGEV